jgi:hypothetical protein
MSNEGGVSILLYLRDKRDPSWMSSKWQATRKSDDLKEGRTFRVLVILGFEG